jgi:hypothetical protein
MLEGTAVTPGQPPGQRSRRVFRGALQERRHRLGTTAETWQARLEKLKAGRLLGRFFAASRDRLREVSERLKVHHLANLAGCPAR